MRIWPETHRNASVHAQKTKNYHTYLVGAQLGACIDEVDRLESCPACWASIIIHIHGDVGNSKRPAKMSETPDLPARGTELCRNEPERLASQSDESNTCTGTQMVHKHMQSIESSPSGNTCKRISKPELTCQRHKTAHREARNGQNGCAGHAHVQRDTGSSSTPANTLESPGLTYQWRRTRSQKGFNIFIQKLNAYIIKGNFQNCRFTLVTPCFLSNF